MALCEVAAYYFPHWHADPRNDQWHGQGWTEWELVKAAKPRYEGHRQPILPAWGHYDESDPINAAREIDAAASHGITAFIYDYYHYEDGPFLDGALDHGFLGAENNDRIRFALIWANHDWANYHPVSLGTPHPVLIPGKVSPAAYDRMISLIIERYFSHPSYLRVEGCPYFSVFDLVTFVDSMGGVDGAREALERFQLKAAAAGLPGIHFNAVLWRSSGLAPTWQPFGGPHALVEALGFDSVTPYNWCEHYDPCLDTFPRGSYAKAASANFIAWEHESKRWKIPYIPNVTAGWDCTPRCAPTDKFEKRQYPWTPVLEGNTPAAFRSALEHAKSFLAKPEAKIKMLTLSAWNEWTEGAYLLPDATHGMANLEMVKRVFIR